MRIIAVVNPLGGVGKTTIAVNLAASLAERGIRVLLVDLDAQACATVSLGLAIEAGGSLYSALVDGTPPQSAICSTRLPNLFVIRSHHELADAEIKLVQRGQHLTRLRDVLAELRVLPDFDYILLDCPPSQGVITSTAMAAADELLVPIDGRFLTLESISRLLRHMQQVIDSGANPALHVGGVVINRFASDASHVQEEVKDVRGYLADHVSAGIVYETVIPRSVRLAEAPSYGQTIVEYDPQGQGTEAYRALAQEFMDRHAIHSQSR